MRLRVEQKRKKPCKSLTYKAFLLGGEGDMRTALLRLA